MIFEPEKTIDAWYDWFIDISQAFFSLALPKEELSIGVQGDLADFLRWNKAAIVQASHIERIVGHLSVRSRQRQASCSVVFCGDRSADLEMIQRQTNQLRSWLTNSPKDPFFVPNAPPYRAHPAARSLCRRVPGSKTRARQYARSTSGRSRAAHQGAAPQQTHRRPP